MPQPVPIPTETPPALVPYASVEQLKVYAKSARSGSDKVVPEDTVMMGVLLGAFTDFLANLTMRNFWPTPATRAQLVTALPGVNNDLIFTAIEDGPQGNFYQIVYVNAGPSRALALDVTGNVFTVTLATDASGDVTTRAGDIANLFANDVIASAMIYVNNAPNNDGTGLLMAMPATFLHPVDYNPSLTREFIYPIRGDLRIPDLRKLDGASTNPAGGITYGTVPLISDDFIQAYKFTPPDLDTPATHIYIDRSYVGPMAWNRKLKIAGWWGFVQPPQSIVHATLVMAARAMAQKDARWADSQQAGLESQAFTYFQALPGPLKAAVNLLRISQVAIV